MRFAFEFNNRRQWEPFASPPRPFRLLRQGKPLTINLSPGDLGMELDDFTVPGGR